LQILSDGPTKLYCHQKTKVTAHTGAMNPKKYYYINYHNKMMKFKPGRFAFIHLFDGTNRDKIKTIIRQNHLHVRHETDLARAVDLFNQP
jgi:hypothetical protein